MVEIDVKNLIDNGPEKLVMAINNAINSERTKEAFEITKVLRTFIFDSPLKAEISISKSGSPVSKISGTVKWIGDRRDGKKGIEIFLDSRENQKPFIIGIDNLESAKFNSEKRLLLISQVPLVCPVCKGIIKPGDVKIKCPACGVVAHKDHFLEYLKIHGTCPSCGKRLSTKSKK
ncbi:MAG: hypothetical protein ACTSWR_06325 [Candidatus Helarchaeota archaeon]